MTKRENSEYYIVCDRCGKESSPRFTKDTSLENIQKVILSYKSENTENGWYDLCPACQEEIND